MHSINLLIGLLAILIPACFATTAAPVTEKNPQGAAYIAAFPKDGAVGGSVVASSVANGTGVTFEVSISGLPVEGGPFTYHIHEAPVSSDGNCSSTLDHLDPYKVGDTTKCNETAQPPQTCQVGDLAGKHGSMPGPGGYAAKYVDPYVSTAENTSAFLGNLSIVVHYANKTRIMCANFTMNANANDNDNGGAATQPAPTATTVTGGATKTAVAYGGGAVALGIAAMIL